MVYELFFEIDFNETNMIFKFFLEYFSLLNGNKFFWISTETFFEFHTHTHNRWYSIFSLFYNLHYYYRFTDFFGRIFYSLFGEVMISSIIIIIIQFKCMEKSFNEKIDFHLFRSFQNLFKINYYFFSQIQLFIIIIDELRMNYN